MSRPLSIKGWVHQRLGRDRSERGAVMVLAGVAMAGVLASTAIAVDIGNATAFKKALQADADLAAIDAVRALGDRKGEGGLAPQALAELLAGQSLGRNGFDVGAAGNSWNLTLGNLDATRTFIPAAVPSSALAVKVTLAGPVEWSFQPGGRSFVAEGVAELPVGASTSGVAGIALGSWVARLDTSKSAVLNGVLGGFLGGAVNLDLVSYQGLAAGTVTLRGLGTALGIGVGTPDALLDTNVTLRNLLTATASALTAQGGAVSLAAATRTTTLAAAVSPAVDLRLGELIQVAQGGGAAALDAGINVFQLISMAAQVADTDHFLSLTLPVSVPLVASTTLQLQVIEAPRIAIGPAKQVNGAWVTRLTTAQIRAQLTVSLLNGLSILGIARPVRLPIYIEGGGARAELRSLTCGPTPAQEGAGVWTRSQALTARVGEVAQADLADVSTAVSVAPGTLVNVAGLIRISGTSTFNSTATETTLNFTGPWPQTKSNGGSTTLGLAPLLQGGLTLDLDVLGLGFLLNPLLGSITSSLVALLAPVFSVLDNAVIDPLLSAVGLSLGGADVTVFDHHCQTRRIVN